MGKKKTVGIFCLILALQCAVILAWGTQKVRLNIDEMFTMEGVRQGGQSMQYWDKAEGFYGNEHTHQEFLNYMTVTVDDLLVNQGVMAVYKALLHKEFYYSVLNLVVTFYPGHVPWAVGVGLNLLFFVIAQILLFLLSKKILGEVSALCVVTAYGFSAGAISTVLYVRCYMMLTLYVLLLIYLYVKFMCAEKNWQRLLYVAGLEIMAFLCYRTHQFGVILFAIITALFVFYMMVSKKKICLMWLAIGYGAPFLVGSKMILPLLYRFLGGGVATLFYSIAGSMDVSRLAGYIVQAGCVVAKHLFVRVRVVVILVAGMLLLCGRIRYVRGKDKKRDDRGAGIYWPVIVISVVAVAVYYGILVMGSAIAWKYLSPVYPLIMLAFISIVTYIIRIMKVSFRAKVVIVASGVILTFTSYDTKHISELFAEEDGMRELLETEYQGVNGIMVHHDVQGDGENYLYEAAALWPQNSNVLVLQHHMLLEDNLFSPREDDRILLWLTADFDREESIALFMERTDYTDIRLVLNTDHVWVYECNK